MSFFLNKIPAKWTAGVTSWYPAIGQAAPWSEFWGKADQWGLVGDLSFPKGWTL